MAILVIFAGTQGFVISSHTCNSCGTHEATISLFAQVAAERHDCQAEQAGSCCTTPDTLTETNGQCCSATTTSCETITGGVCCEYGTERVAVETFTTEKSSRIDVHIQPLVVVTTYCEALTPEPNRVSFDLHNKHGGGREIVLLTCCFLI